MLRLVLSQCWPEQDVLTLSGTVLYRCFMLCFASECGCSAACPAYSLLGCGCEESEQDLWGLSAGLGRFISFQGVQMGRVQLAFLKVFQKMLLW